MTIKFIFMATSRIYTAAILLSALVLTGVFYPLTALSDDIFGFKPPKPPKIPDPFEEVKKAIEHPENIIPSNPLSDLEGEWKKAKHQAERHLPHLEVRSVMSQVQAALNEELLDSLQRQGLILNQQTGDVDF